MRRILTGGLLATMLLALVLAGFTDFLEPATPPRSPSHGSAPARDPAMDRAVPLPALPPADAPLPDSLPGLEREAVQLREGLAQIDQAMDRMLDGVLSVLRPYGEARTADGAAARRLEMLSALRGQSLDRLARIERRRAGIEAGADAPPLAAATPAEPVTGLPDGAQPFRTAMVAPALSGFSATGDTAGTPGGEPGAGTGEAAPATLAAPASPTLADSSPESRASAEPSWEPPRAALGPDDPAALPLPPPVAPFPAAPFVAPSVEKGAGRVAKLVPRSLRAEPASLRSAAANPARCRSIILRGQLGEGLSFADRSFLRDRCPG